MKLQSCINFILSHVQNTVFLYFKKELAQYNVTPIQYSLLKCLWDEDGQMPSQIAATLCLDSSTITGIIDRLSDKGLITRHNREDNRRSVSIRLTDEGRALQKPIEALIARLNEEALAGVDPADYETAKTVLAKIACNVSELL